MILTGEYIPENFLLSRDGADWHLAGLFDFGDVMTGRGEYDLLGPSAFMTAGMPRRVQQPVRGLWLFGRRYHARAEAAADGADAAASLSAIPSGSICIEGWQQKAADLVELQDLIWPV